MISRSNPFFELDAKLDQPQPARLYARIEHKVGKRVLLEAVDADWFDRLIGESSSPDLLREVGPSAPISILECSSDEWRRLRYRESQDPDRSRRSRPWVELWIADRGLKVMQYRNLYSEARQIRVERAMTAHHAVTLGFANLLTLSPYIVTQSEIETALPDGSDRIDWIAVYDVGQGAANALLDENGFPCMYVDLGGGVLGHYTSFPQDFKKLCLTRNPSIVLSHWDWDHWSSAGRFPATQTMTWIVPNQKIGIVHGVFAALVLANGTLMVWPSGLASVHSGQISILKCLGKDRNNSGLAISIAGPSGEPPILLPGDASYWNVPTGTNVHHSVVAPHHGANMGATMPKAGGGPTGRVAYSYGANNQWSHPVPITMNRHVSAGWPHGTAPSAGCDRHTTHRGIAPALGHIGLSWGGGKAPSPPCQGICCDQAIFQT